MTAAAQSRTVTMTVRWCQRGLAIASSLALLTMMFLTGADVIARYVFNAPIRGAYELIEMLMVAFVYLAMPLAVLSNSHVEVEIWKPKSDLAKGLRHGLAGLCGGAVFLVMAVELWSHAAKFSSRDTVTNSLGIPLSIVAYVAFLGASLCAAFVLLAFFKRINQK